MPVESAADLAGFFNSDEFGAAGEWTLAAGVAAHPVTVILSRPAELVDVGEASVQLTIPVARIALADVPQGAGKGDVLKVGTEAWRVERIDPDMARATARVILKARA